MTTYQLTQRACDFDLPSTKTVTADCIHVDDDFVRFHDADHQLVYAVQRSLLLAFEAVKDEELDKDQADVEPEPDKPAPMVVGIKLDGRSIFEAFARAQLAAQRRRGPDNLH